MQSEMQMQLPFELQLELGEQWIGVPKGEVSGAWGHWSDNTIDY